MRLFIAVEIPHEIREKIYRDLQPLHQAFQKIKWIPSKNLHLTLKFLGEVPEEKLKMIKEKMRSLSSLKSFSIEFLGLGGFPNLNRPRVIWLGINQGKQELLQIASYLESELEMVGFPRENRTFQAHLTLARVKDFREMFSTSSNSNILRAKSGFSSPCGTRSIRSDEISELFKKASFFDKTSFASFSVNMVSLMQSSLTREGATYQCLHQIRLG